MEKLHFHYSIIPFSFASHIPHEVPCLLHVWHYCDASPSLCAKHATHRQTLFHLFRHDVIVPRPIHRLKDIPESKTHFQKAAPPSWSCPSAEQTLCPADRWHVPFDVVYYITQSATGFLWWGNAERVRVLYVLDFLFTHFIHSVSPHYACRCRTQVLLNIRFFVDSFCH